MQKLIMGLILMWLGLTTFSAYGGDRLGFQSAAGFYTINNVQSGWAGYVFIGHIRPDGSQDISVPATVTSTNPALLVVKKLPKPILQGGFWVNYQLSIPSGAKPGLVDICALMSFNGTLHKKKRTFNIVVNPDKLSPQVPSTALNSDPKANREVKITVRAEEQLAVEENKIANRISLDANLFYLSMISHTALQKFIIPSKWQ